jgi:hypothetical protein
VKTAQIGGTVETFDQEKQPGERCVERRQLRDLYQEQFNTGRILPAGKYQVTRALATAKPSKLLEA